MNTYTLRKLLRTSFDRKLSTLLKTALPIALICTTFNSFAGWEDGLGVVYFPSGDEEKVIFYGNPDTNAAYTFQSLFDYGNYLAPLVKDSNHVPGNFLPGVHYELSSNDEMKLIGHPTSPSSSFLITKHVASTDNPLLCNAGTSCGEIAMIVGKDQCTSRDFSVDFSANWEYLPFDAEEPFTGAIGASHTRGFSTCTSTSQAYTCYANQGESLPYRTLTYATVEHRAAFGDAPVTPESGTIVESENNPYNSTYFKSKCESVGGTYVNPRRGPKRCENITNKVYFDEYDLWPIEYAATVSACRVIKD